MKYLRMSLVTIGVACIAAAAGAVETSYYPAVICNHNGLSQLNSTALQNNTGSTQLTSCGFVTRASAAPTIDKVEVRVQAGGVTCLLRNASGASISPDSTTYDIGWDTINFTTDQTAGTLGWALECSVPNNMFVESYKVILK
jgi:hypothetical protein